MQTICWRPIVIIDLLALGGALAGTLPDSSPVPELCPDSDGSHSCAENYGHFKIPDTAGNPIHTVRNRKYVLMRYIVPPDTTVDFVFTYEATDAEPATINFQAAGENNAGDLIYSRSRSLDVFIGGKGDLLLEDFQRTTTQTVIGDDLYTPDAPLNFTNTVTNLRDARYAVTVQNEGAATASFIL